MPRTTRRKVPICLPDSEPHVDKKAKTTNRPDEWKIEQGLSGAVLPVLDMTGPKTKSLAPQTFGTLTRDDAAIEAVGDTDKLFAIERKGWTGYVT